MREPELIPEFVEGEQIIVQRNVNGKNVFMYLTVQDPCSISKNRMVLTAQMNNWGESAHADGRVANQAASIDRLLAHLLSHCTSLECAHRVQVES